jgi:hypothetical protein
MVYEYSTLVGETGEVVLAKTSSIWLLEVFEKGGLWLDSVLLLTAKREV